MQTWLKPLLSWNVYMTFSSDYHRACKIQLLVNVCCSLVYFMIHTILSFRHFHKFSRSYPDYFPHHCVWRRFHVMTTSWFKLWCCNVNSDMFKCVDISITLTCMSHDDMGRERNNNVAMYIFLKFPPHDSVLWLIRRYLREKTKPPITKTLTGCRTADFSHTVV